MNRDRDLASAETLILDHLPDIVTLCNRMFAQLSDAQDATHEAVIGILRDLPSYRGDGPVRHWVLKVALNAARNHRRKLARGRGREMTLTDQEPPPVDPPDPAGEREEREALRGAIARLPDELREPLVLYYYHRMTQVEIGAALACSQKTVHQRIRKALANLNRRLAGSGALGALLVAPGAGAGGVALDAVSPALAASVKQSIASYHAASAAAATATGVSTGGTSSGTAAASGAATPIAFGEAIGTTGVVATGGVVMQAKILAGAAVLAVSCLVGGAMLSERVFASGSDEEHRAEVADLQARVDAGRRELETLRGVLAEQKQRRAGRISELSAELDALRVRVHEQDVALAEREEQLQRLGATAGSTDGGQAADPAAARSREERWKDIHASVAGVMDVLRKMMADGANQFELGPQLVAELAKLTPAQIDEMMAFDAVETDPRRLDEIRMVMLQALIFVDDVGPQRNDYMERYLERARKAGPDDGFAVQALRRVSFSMPPFVDAYTKIVGRLDEDVQVEFLETALDRTTRGASEELRVDGVAFLARSGDPRATAELMRVFGQTSNSRRLRATALKGLATRADENVLRLLRDAEGTEEDEQLRAAVKQAADRVAKLIETAE